MRPKEMDNIIRSAADSGKFEFNEADWAAARDLIKKKKPDYRWLLILILPLAIAAYYVSPDNALTQTGELSSFSERGSENSLKEIKEDNKKEKAAVPVVADRENTRSYVNGNTSDDKLYKEDKIGQIVTDEDHLQLELLQDNKSDLAPQVDVYSMSEEPRKQIAIEKIDGILPGILAGKDPEPALPNMDGTDSVYKKWATSISFSHSVNHQFSKRQWETSVGLSLMRFLPNGCYLNFQPEISMSYGDPAVTKVVKKLSYGVEVMEQMFGIRPGRIVSGEIPLSVGLAVENWRFDVGYGLRYLIAGHGEIYEIIEVDGDIEQIEKVSEGWLKRDHSLDIIHGPQININYRINSLHEVGVAGRYYNAAFFNKNSETQIQSQQLILGLNYHFYFL